MKIQTIETSRLLLRGFTKEDSLERVGTCSFMISEDKKIYDIAYCVHKNSGARAMQPKSHRE